MPSERSEGVRRPGLSQVRAKLRQARAHALPEGEGSPRRAPAAASSGREEPSTGVVRRIEPAPARSVPAPRAPQERRPNAKSDSQILRREEAKREPAAVRRDEEDLRTWRCLEWGQPPREERPRRNPKVTIVQLSGSGELVRQNGPDAWLPEAGDFMHRMSTLVARGLGFERCRSICLKAPSTVLAVSEVNEAKVMVMSGSHRSLANVLRRAGLE